MPLVCHRVFRFGSSSYHYLPFSNDIIISLSSPSISFTFSQRHLDVQNHQTGSGFSSLQMATPLLPIYIGEASRGQEPPLVDSPAVFLMSSWYHTQLCFPLFTIEMFFLVFDHLKSKESVILALYSLAARNEKLLLEHMVQILLIWKYRISTECWASYIISGIGLTCGCQK